MLFDEIERERRRLGITQRALCSSAGVLPQLYTKWLKGKHGITQCSLEKLETALTQLKEAATGE